MWTKNCFILFYQHPKLPETALYFHVVARNEPMVYTKDRCKNMAFFWNIQIFYIIFLIFAVKSAFFWFKTSIIGKKAVLLYNYADSAEGIK